MAQWTILHNPKCSKSREALKLLQDNGIEPKVVEYLKTPLNQSELKTLMSQLDSEPASMVRTKEALYKELKFSLDSKDQIIKFIAEHPVLLERPIVIKDKKAVIGRPTENINKLL